MAYLDDVVDIAELGQRSLWTVYGKSGSGKTKFGSSFPKPMIYLQICDDGSNTIAQTEGIKAKRVGSVSDLKLAAKELVKDKKYASVFCDTFSLLTNEWQDENVIQKKKKMTQQSWGDLKVETEEIIKLFHKVALNHHVILSCHESLDSLEGMEDEILPDIRPSVTKGARTYLEGMTNYGIHCTKLKKIVIKDGVEQELIKFAAHIGANPYYWTKFQIDSEIKLPKVMMYPTYNKIQKLIGGNE